MVDSAIENNDIKLLEALFAENKAEMTTYCVLPKARNDAAKWGHVEVLQWLWEKGMIDLDDLRYQDNLILQIAAQKGHVKVIEWLLDRKAVTLSDCLSRRCSVLVNAASAGQITVLEWAKEKGLATQKTCQLFGCVMLWRAVKQKQVVVMNWLWEQSLVTAEDYSSDENRTELVFSLLKTVDNVEMIEWLWERNLIDFELFRTRILSGYYVTIPENLKLMKWLWKREILTLEHCLSTNGYIIEATYNNNWDAIVYLEKKGAVTKTNCRKNNCEALRVAVSRENVQITERLRVISEATLADFYSAALLSNISSVPTLEWLRKQGGCTTRDYGTMIGGFSVLYIIISGFYWNKLKNNCIEWIALHTDVAPFVACGMKHIWEKTRKKQRESAVSALLALVVAGRRNKVRQPPPELWEHIVEEYC
jgi:hypothetical protein